MLSSSSQLVEAMRSQPGFLRSFQARLSLAFPEPARQGPLSTSSPHRLHRGAVAVSESDRIHRVEEFPLRRAFGHSKPTTTLAFYVRWIPTSGKNFAALLDAKGEEKPGIESQRISQQRRSRRRNLVSREGIEPSTYRLRVCCSAN
jgi:hypothetical protein